MSTDTDQSPAPVPNDASNDAGDIVSDSPRVERDVRDGPLPLLLFAALIGYLGVAVSWWAVAAVLGIALMIALHEFGHFLAAKRGGMKVTEYFLGFGPRLWSITRGETTYGLKAIPLGAYVRVIGMSNLEEVPPEDEARTYRQATYPRRMAVAVAGSTMHFLQAFVLLMVVYSAIGIPTQRWTIREVTDGSAASAAGLQTGDKLISVGGQPVGDFSDLGQLLAASAGTDTPIVFTRNGEQMTGHAVIAEKFDSDITTAISGLEANDRLVKVDGADVRTYNELQQVVVPGSTHKIEVLRHDSLCTVNATVNSLPPTVEVTRGFLGVSADYASERINPLRAAGRSVGDFGSVTSAAVSGIVKFFHPKNVGSFVSDSVQSPSTDASECHALSADENRILSIYGFGRIASDAGRHGLGDFLELFAMFNIFIGVFNLMPLLPFDGGHVVVATYERLRTRRGKRHFADMTKLMPLTYAVAGLMVFLGVLALFRDIIQPPSIGG